MKEDLEEFSLKELLAYSIESEEDAKKFYTDFTKIGVGRLVKERFKSLANDEKVHKEELLDRYENEFGDRDYEDEIPDSDKLPPHETAYNLSDVDNAIDSLQKAIENEENAKMIYKYMAQRFDDYASFFRYLALMEKGHYETLSEELSLMQGEARDEEDKGPKEKIKSLWTDVKSRRDSSMSQGEDELGLR